jgi:HEAT repeat protein
VRPIRLCYSGTATTTLALVEASSASGNDPTQKGVILRALGESSAPTPAVIQTLVQALGDPDPYVRESAIQALGQLGPQAKDVLPTLSTIVASSKESASVKQNAAWAVRRIEGRQP